MPQYFKIHGYYTAGTGKVYHPGEPPNNDPPSWTETYNPRGQQFIKKPHYVCKQHLCSVLFMLTCIQC